MPKAKSTQSSRKSRRTHEAAQDNFLDPLFLWLDASLVLQTAGELARQCHAKIKDKIAEELAEMTAQEAESHVKAHAVLWLDEEIDSLLKRRRVRDTLRQRILAEASEQLVGLIGKSQQRSKGRQSLKRVA